MLAQWLTRSIGKGYWLLVLLSLLLLLSSRYYSNKIFHYLLSS